MYRLYYYFFRVILLASGVGQPRVGGDIRHKGAVSCPPRRFQPWIRLRHHPRRNFRSREQRSAYRKSCDWRVRFSLVGRFLLQHGLPLAHVPCSPACQPHHWELRFQRSVQMMAFRSFLAAAHPSCLGKLIFLVLSINGNV